MGQYHCIYNKTKKESFSIGGAKLWEKTHAATAAGLLLLLSNSNGRGGGDFCAYPQDYDKLTLQEKENQRIIDKVSGRWAGDIIVVQGDYAEPTDAAFIAKDEFKDYRSITFEVAEALLIADNGDESDVVKIIESELGHKFGSFKDGLKNVEKAKAMDRNRRRVSLYQASLSDKKIKKRGAK